MPDNAKGGRTNKKRPDHRGSEASDPSTAWNPSQLIHSSSHCPLLFLSPCLSAGQVALEMKRQQSGERSQRDRFIWTHSSMTEYHKHTHTHTLSDTKAHLTPLSQEQSQQALKWEFITHTHTHTHSKRKSSSICCELPVLKLNNERSSNGCKAFLQSEYPNSRCRKA